MKKKKGLMGKLEKATIGNKDLDQKVLQLKKSFDEVGKLINRKKP